MCSGSVAEWLAYAMCMVAKLGQLVAPELYSLTQIRLSSSLGVITALAHFSSSNLISFPSQCYTSLIRLIVPSIGSGSVLTRLVQLMATSVVIQKLLLSKSYIILAEPTGLFLGLWVVNACMVDV